MNFKEDKCLRLRVIGVVKKPRIFLNVITVWNYVALTAWRMGYARVALMKSVINEMRVMSRSNEF